MIWYMDSSEVFTNSLKSVSTQIPLGYRITWPMMSHVSKNIVGKTSKLTSIFVNFKLIIKCVIVFDIIYLWNRLLWALSRKPLFVLFVLVLSKKSRVQILAKFSLFSGTPQLVRCQLTGFSCYIYRCVWCIWSRDTIPF